MKKSFLNYDYPLITAMVLCETPEDAIEKIKASIKDGADAIGVQLEFLKKEYRTKEIITKIFEACEDKPIYVTSYRGKNSEGITDDERVELTMLAIECGGTLFDIVGSTYDIDADNDIAVNEEAIKKQTELADIIHKKGKEVLISSHTFKNITIDEAMKIAKAQAERNTDIIKIMATTDNEEDIPKYIEIIQKIKKETNKEFLLVVSDKGKLIREIGPNFGVCMYLAVSSHNEFDVPEQPTVKHIKKVRDAFYK